MTAPIFIHSLFRSGSTYIFNRFRHSSHRYWCYQEPLNEFLVNAKQDPERLLEVHEDNARHLRHPLLDRPYFYEFHSLAKEIGQAFLPEFSYEHYFADSRSSNEPLVHYLRILLEGAKGRPVLQDCRSCGRVKIIQEAVGGCHIFLWRNPWDQWWSYKVDSHFEICNLQILASSSAPPIFIELRSILNFYPNGNDIEDLIACRLDAAGSYMLFFALWCHAMLEARPICSVSINIDSLSRNKNYRSMIIDSLGESGIDDLDFATCAIPISAYGVDDQRFFEQIEDQVFDLFLRHGYRQETLDGVRRERLAHDVHVPGRSSIDALVAKENDRLRHVARRLESELAGAQRAMGGQQRLLSQQSSARKLTDAALVTKEAERQQLELALEAKEAERHRLELALGAKEAERHQLELALGAKEAERHQLELDLKIQKQALHQILASRSWRAGAPFRAIARMIDRYI